MRFIHTPEEEALIRAVRAPGVLRCLLELLGDADLPPENEIARRVRAGLFNEFPLTTQAAWRRNDIDHALNRVLGRTEALGILCLNPLHSLAREHLHLAGNRVELRHRQAHTYTKLIADIEPAFLIAALMTEPFEAEETPIGVIGPWLDEQPPLGLPPPEIGRVYADNHVHYGGVSAVSHALMAAVSGWEPAEEGKTLDDLLPDSFRATFGQWHLRPVTYLLSVLGALIAAFVKQVAGLGTRAELAEALQLCRIRTATSLPGRLVLMRLIVLQFAPPVASVEQALLYEIGHRAVHNDWGKSFQALALLIARVDRHTQDHAPWLRLLMMALVQTSHALRDAIIMNGNGLTTFMEYFKSSPRKSNHQDFNPLTSLLGHEGHLVDIKMSRFDRKELNMLARSSARLTAQNKTHRPQPRETTKEAHHPWRRYHVTYHFSRTSWKTETFSELSLRWGARRHKINKHAEKIRDALAIRQPSEDAVALDDRIWRQELGSRLRVFDVAGEEQHGPIELFAPALRWLRGAALAQTGQEPPHLVPQRQLSVHAGEDFDHLLNGLRHIDETVEFCDMGLNDRIGHGLSLGICPMAWASRRRQVFPTREAHLDSLVWLWHQASLLATELPLASQMLPDLERRIQYYGSILYKGRAVDALLTPDTLYRAWRLRKNCPLKARMHWADQPTGGQEAHNVWPGGKYWVPEPYDHDGAATVDRLYQLNLGTRQERILVELQTADMLKGNALLTAKPPELESDRDFHGPLMWHLIEAVQDRLMTVYDQRGIVLEACPSSNLHIGGFGDLSAHPCLRWYPAKIDTLIKGEIYNRHGLRRGPVRVCLNTDDPGVFPTTIAHEHRQMIEVAQRAFGLSHWEADAWGERLRKVGVEVFQHAHAGASYIIELEN